MSLTDFFLNPQHWSVTGFIFLVLLLLVYTIKLRTTVAQKIFFTIGVTSIYIVLGSPLAEFKAFGLHSIVMLQQIILLMVAPVWILRGLPITVVETKFLNKLSLFRHPKKYVLITWFAASVVMWGGHYVNAALSAVKTGMLLNNFQMAQESWLASIPYTLLCILFFITGFAFALPVFHPNKSKRLHPVKSVLYLFTACLSCSVLGLYITFMASSPSAINSFPMFTDPYHIITLTPKADQEIAGLLMWVPGCILYVVSSMALLLPWYDSNVSLYQSKKETNSIEKPYRTYGN